MTTINLPDFLMRLSAAHSLYLSERATATWVIGHVRAVHRAQRYPIAAAIAGCVIPLSRNSTISQAIGRDLWATKRFIGEHHAQVQPAPARC